VTAFLSRRNSKCISVNQACRIPYFSLQMSLFFTIFFVCTAISDNCIKT
jgi:hypothetical protein